MKKHSVILTKNRSDYIGEFSLCVGCLLPLFDIDITPDQIRVTLCSTKIKNSIKVHRNTSAIVIVITIENHSWPKFMWRSFADYLSERGTTQGKTFYISVKAYD